MRIPEYITFDCYGTLVDFRLTEVTLEVLGERLEGVDTDRFAADYERIRFEEVLEPYKPYRDVIKTSLRKALALHDLQYTELDGERIVAAIPEFGPFPEVPEVLRQLNRHCKLVIITNSDNDLIPGNVERIGVPFHRVITSEDAGAYKPSLQVFDYVLETLDTDPARILHVAQGFDYDIVPAHAKGWARVWINRRGQPGDQAYGPYAELPDLSGLPDLIGLPEA